MSSSDDEDDPDFGEPPWNTRFAKTVQKLIRGDKWRDEDLKEIGYMWFDFWQCRHGMPKVQSVGVDIDRVVSHNLETDELNKLEEWWRLKYQVQVARQAHPTRAVCDILGEQKAQKMVNFEECLTDTEFSEERMQDVKAQLHEKQSYLTELCWQIIRQDLEHCQYYIDCDDWWPITRDAVQMEPLKNDMRKLLTKENASKMLKGAMKYAHPIVVDQLEPLFAQFMTPPPYLAKACNRLVYMCWKWSVGDANKPLPPRFGQLLECVSSDVRATEPDLCLTPLHALFYDYGLPWSMKFRTQQYGKTVSFNEKGKTNIYNTEIAFYNVLEAIKALIDHGVDVNAKFPHDSETPLCFALSKTFVEKCYKLHGIRSNMQYYETHYRKHIQDFCKSAIELIVSNGADPDQCYEFDSKVERFIEASSGRNKCKTAAVAYAKKLRTLFKTYQKEQLGKRVAPNSPSKKQRLVCDSYGDSKLYDGDSQCLADVPPSAEKTQKNRWKGYLKKIQLLERVQACDQVAKLTRNVSADQAPKAQTYNRSAAKAINEKAINACLPAMASTVGYLCPNCYQRRIEIKIASLSSPAVEVENSC
eukprot:SAG25_NODE_73_length_17157_cov_11.762575_7_plen_587_part_00